MMFKSLLLTEGYFVAPAVGEDDDERTRVVGGDELIDILGREAQKAIDGGGSAIRYGVVSASLKTAYPAG